MWGVDALEAPPPLSPPPSPPSPSPPLSPGSLFTTTGPCSVTADCFYSPGYAAGSYDNAQDCTFTAHQTMMLSVQTFATESCCDYLTVNDVQYKGTTGPAGIIVEAGSTMTFHTDHSVLNNGFGICGGMSSCSRYLLVLD